MNQIQEMSILIDILGTRVIPSILKHLNQWSSGEKLWAIGG